MSHPIRSKPLAVAALTVALLTSAVPAGLASTAQGGRQAPAPTSRTRSGKLRVGVEVLRFTAKGSSLQAVGQVTGTLTDNSGHSAVVKDTIALSAATGGGCRVLHLFLNELTLNLLGLNAHLDKVTLDITGSAHGGVLGALFCRLAHAKIASARTTVLQVRALNARLRQGRVRSHALRFTAYLNPQSTRNQAPGAVCPVLDLVVGPLNLQLLGLIVDLQKVHLTVTATRSQGKLGDLFCTLANQ